ncbi:MAG TPA: hypothetical protein VHT97_15095 [Acidimicrobiales bacterium]|nr:hypothetical protein [Acidimicrobiales bacterium]
MTPEPVTPDKDGDKQPLLLDELSSRLEQFRLLYDSDQAATDDMLTQLGGQGPVEREMLRELAAARPLRSPERVPEAHAVAMRALEVLSRNGSRPPSQLPRMGPLTGASRFLVQQVIRYVVRRHQTRVVDAVHDLYVRRLAWVPVGDPSRVMLLRARLDVERVSSSYKKSTGGFPAFLVGGAAVSSVTQVLRTGASAAAGSRVGVVVGVAVTFVLLAAASWVVLRGAAIARRRIKLSLDHPLAALWETVGWCGHPPKDTSGTVAAVAIALTIVGWLVIPLGLLVLFTVF